MNAGPSSLLAYWGLTELVRMPDALILTCRPEGSVAKELLRKAGYRQRESGDFARKAKNCDPVTSLIMYPQLASSDPVRLVDDPHPGAFLYLQVEVCLDHFGGRQSDHGRWAYGRYVWGERDTSRNQLRFGREVRSHLLGMIEINEELAKWVRYLAKVAQLERWARQKRMQRAQSPYSVATEEEMAFAGPK